MTTSPSNLDITSDQKRVLVFVTTVVSQVLKSKPEFLAKPKDELSCYVVTSVICALRSLLKGGIMPWDDDVYDELYDIADKLASTIPLEEDSLIIT